MKRFNFYLPDEDRNSGWSNHTYVLQFVAQGMGNTIGEAWNNACINSLEHLGVPDEFKPESDNLVVIEEQNELTFVDPRSRDWKVTWTEPV